MVCTLQFPYQATQLVIHRHWELQKQRQPTSVDYVTAHLPEKFWTVKRKITMGKTGEGLGFEMSAHAHTAENKQK